MSNDEIFDYLKEEFDKEKAPESLSKENMLLKLQDVKQEKKTDISFFKTFASVAAVLAVIVVSAFGVNFFFDNGFELADIAQEDTLSTAVTASSNEETTNESIEAASEETSGSSVLQRLGSDEELKANFLQLYKDSTINVYAQYKNYSGLKGDVTAAATDKNSSSVVFDNSIDAAVGTTNVQVLGVDEGDIVKNDGRFLYIIGNDATGNTKLRIVDTETMQYVYNEYIMDENGDIVAIDQLYLYNNHLVVLSRKANAVSAAIYGYSSYSWGYYGNSDVVVYVYDISDKSDVKLKKTTVQSGNYVSSRMIDGVLYTVSKYIVPLNDEKTIEENFMPKINGAFYGCDCIYIQNKNSQTYMCLTANDITNADSEIGKIAILGDSDGVYCSTENMYVISTEYYNSSEYTDKDINKFNVNSYTTINSFSLNGTVITHTASGEVPGIVGNQYWLDEKDGYLRVGTNYYDYSKNDDSNALFVLDEKLELVGKLMGIADGEDIESIRFMGDKGYIVTYEQVDPLFAFDLSDPAEPKITGELKLPGYSVYLHPISDTLLLGVGYDGTNTNANFNNVKVSLFDISDMSEPKELDNIIFENQYSEINESEDAKAFLYIADKNIAVVPTQNQINKYTDKTQPSCNLIKIENGKLELYADYEHGLDTLNASGFIKGTYIGNNFYCVSGNVVTKFDMTTNEKVGQCSLIS